MSSNVNNQASKSPPRPSPWAKSSPRGLIPPPTAKGSRSREPSQSPQRPPTPGGSRRSSPIIPTIRREHRSVDPLEIAPEDLIQSTGGNCCSNGNDKTPNCCFCGDHCFCDDNCACSEELCLCPSYQVSQSLARHQVEVGIHGMTCTQCSKAVERGLSLVSPAFDSATVNISTHSARITNFRNVPIDEEVVRDTIEGLGYEVTSYRVVSSTAEGSHNLSQEVQEFQERQDAELVSLRQSFWVALLFTIPVFVWGLLPHGNISVIILGVRVDQWIMMALATVVQVWCGWEFYRRTWYNRSGMHVLVALGTTAAYGFAFFQLFVSKESSAAWDTAPMLITFIRGGQWMQAAAVSRTRHGLEKLMALQSRTALRVMDSKGKNLLVDPYKEEVVPIEQISVGNILKVIRGASVPADGRIIFGDISVDESMVSGESISVLKSQGGIVLGGTICTEGLAFVQVEAVGPSSALSQIVRIVQEAQSRSVPVQSLVDEVAAVFVPAVCIFSLVTYLVWYSLCSSQAIPHSWYENDGAVKFSLLFSLSCLVISCPCALGLATPTAVMVGTGVGAANGVLVKGGAVLETASKVDTVVFDKTGTLTEGSPVVTDFAHLAFTGKESSEDRQTSEDYTMWLLGSLERNSEHPLAKAIVAFAETKLSETLDTNPFAHPTNFRAITGRGASGDLLGSVSVAVGSRAYASGLGLTVSSKVEKSMTRIEEEGKTAVLAAVDGIAVAVLGVADEVKEDAVDAINYLQGELGLDVWMVTGDNATTAEAVRKKLDLPADRVIAEALPSTKLEKILQLQESGKVVAMVGDGINDSPALAQANVGISLASGAEIAAEAADIVLVTGKRVREVCTALHLTRCVFRRIQWNLVWSLVYNCVAIPAAAGVLFPLNKERLPPTIAAAAMALSSVSVVLSSLMLYRYKPPSISPTNARPNAPESRERNELRLPLLEHNHCTTESDSTDQVDNLSSIMEQGQDHVAARV